MLCSFVEGYFIGTFIIGTLRLPGDNGSKVITIDQLGAPAVAVPAFLIIGERALPLGTEAIEEY